MKAKIYRKTPALKIQLVGKDTFSLKSEVNYPWSLRKYPTKNQEIYPPSGPKIHRETALWFFSFAFNITQRYGFVFSCSRCTFKNSKHKIIKCLNSLNSQDFAQCYPILEPFLEFARCALARSLVWNTTRPSLCWVPNVSFSFETHHPWMCLCPFLWSISSTSFSGGSSSRKCILANTGSYFP